MLRVCEDELTAFPPFPPFPLSPRFARPDVSRPLLTQHRSAFVADLNRLRPVEDRESSAGAQSIAAYGRSEALCPECARP